MGGRTTVHSSSGKVALQKACLQSPCWSTSRSATAMEVSRRSELYLRTGAYRLDLE